MDYPCLRCAKHVKKTEKSVQCYLCEQWVHAGTGGCEVALDENCYRMLVNQKEQGGTLTWSCSSCAKSAARLDKLVQELGRKVTEIGEKVAASDVRVAGVEEEVKELKANVQSLRSNTGQVQENAAAAVFSEMNERERRRGNIIIHGLAEPAATIKDGKAREEADLVKCQELVDLIEVDIQVKNVVQFNKRLGEKKAEPRPLLLGFKDPGAKDLILANTRKLSKADEPWDKVNVVQDLTKMQREDDEKLRKEAEMKNNDMDEEEAKNWMFRVVGQRGQRRLVRARREEDMGGRDRRGGRRRSERRK